MRGLTSMAASLLSAVMLVASAAAAMAANDPPPPKPSEPDGASTDSARTPMITQNPDGTFTVQKEPPSGNSEDANVKAGLVIPRQVVVPEVPLSEKKR